MVMVMVMGINTSAVLTSPGAAPVADARGVSQVDGQVDGQVENIDDEFFALIYSDAELLRDEFDALMAAAWSSPPPAAASRGRDGERPPDRPRPALPPTQGGCRDGLLVRVRDSRARTRSPPDITGGGSSRN